MPFFLMPPPSITASTTKEIEFTIQSTDGTAVIWANGVLNTATDDQFRIANSFMSSNGYDRTTSAINSTSAGMLMASFSVTGLNNGDKVGLFQNQNSGTAGADPNWVLVSKVKPVKVSADQFAQLLKSGKMEKYANSRFIEFYPFGSMERNPQVSEPDWTNSVKLALDEIWGDPLGKSIIKLLSSPVVIRPWIPTALGALSDTLRGTWFIDFSPQSCIDKQVASSPAEVLLHEMVHVIENKKDGYKDLAGFIFDGADFMSINVTNLFSSSKGRALRKDHFRASLTAPPSTMPASYASNASQHAQDLKEDYKIAKAKHPHIFKAASDASSGWNPYAAFNTLKP